MQRQNGTDDEETAPRITRSLRKRLNSDQDVQFVSEIKKPQRINEAKVNFDEDVEFVCETKAIKQGVTRSLRKRLNSIDQDVIHVVDTPTKKTLEPISEDKNVTNKKIQQILEKTESTPTKRMTRRNSILLEESERSESPSVRSSAKKLNSSTLTEENVAKLTQSVPARRTRRATSITESEQREGTPTVRRSARRNSITSDDGSVVSNASALRVTRSTRKSVHIPEDVLLEADENEDVEIPSTPQLNLTKSRKATCKSPSLSPQISTIVTRSASKSPSLPISPEKSVTELKNESLIKTVLNKSIECTVSLDDVTKIKSPVKIIVEESVQTPARKTPIKQTPTKLDTPKNKSLIDLSVEQTKSPKFATPKNKSIDLIVEQTKSPKFVAPKTKTPMKDVTKIEKTPEKQKTPVASRSVCFDKSVSENSGGIKYAATPRSQKNGSKINQSIYEISDSSKDHSIDVSQNDSSLKTKDLNQTDLIITDIVNTVTTNITNASISESILPLVNLEKEGENTPLKNKRLDYFNSSTPITLLGKSNYLEKTPLQPILKKNISLSSGKKPKSEEKKTDFSKSWSQSVVNKNQVTTPIDGFGMEKEDDVIKSKSPKKKNQFDSEFSDTEFNNTDDESEEEKNPYIDDEAMENNEDSMDPEEKQYLEDNEVPVTGFSIGSDDSDDEEEDDEDDDKNSFIVTDEETELLDGSGDDLSNSPNKLNGSAKKIRKRIIDNSSSEEEVEAVKSPKKTPSKLNISQKEKSIKETQIEEEEEAAIKEISSDEETKKIEDNFNSFLKELNSSHKSASDDDQDDDDFVASEEDSEEDLEEGENSDVIRAEEEEMAYRDTILKKFAGTKVNKLNESANKSVKEITPEVSLLNTTFSKTDDEEEETAEEVNVHEKENVEVEEDKNTLNISQKMLSKTRKSMTPLRKSLNVVQASPGLNKSNKNLLNVSTASASGGFIEENIDTETVKTPLKLKRDVVADTKQVTLSDIKKRCEAILHAKEANKKILREEYKIRLQEEGADEKILLKRQKRKQKLEEKQRKAEEKAEILKAFKHSKQLLLEAQLKKHAEAKDASDVEDDDGYLDESEIIPSPQKKKSKKSVSTDEDVFEAKPTKKSKKRQIEEEAPISVEKKKKKLKQIEEEVELPALVEKKKNKNKKKEMEMEAEQVIDDLFHKFDESDSEMVEEPEKKKKKKKNTASTSDLNDVVVKTTSQEEPKKKKKKKISVSSTSDFNVSVLETTPQKKKSKLRMLEKLSTNFVEEPLTPKTKIQSTFKESPLTPKHYNVVNIKSVATKNEKLKKIKKVRKIIEPENVLPKPIWGEAKPAKKRVLSLSDESHHMKGFQVEELEPILPKKTSGFVNSAVEFKKKLAQNTTGRHATKSMLNTMKKKKFN